jgi:hypothetical protein
MSDGDLLLTIVGIIATLLFLSQWLLPALKESGRLQMPRRKSSSFKQFPLHEE